VLDYVSREPFLVARIETHKEPTVLDREVEARGLNLREKALEAVQLLPQAPGELVNAFAASNRFRRWPDMVASFMDLKTAEKQEILATFDLKNRLDRVLPSSPAHRSSESVAPIDDDREAFDERQKEAVLRERLRRFKRAGRKPIPVGRDRRDEASHQGRRHARRRVAEQAEREIKRLEAHAGLVRRILHDPNLPRLAARHALSKVDPETVESSRRETLDQDHYGLQKVKRGY